VWLVIWRGGLAHRLAAMGLLFLADPLFRSGALAANGESVQPEELENYRYDNDDTDNIKDVVTHVL